ncbi:MAG: ankyrin repeat domain-containing protein [Pseudomonadota bacterium]
MVAPERLAAELKELFRFWYVNGPPTLETAKRAGLSPLHSFAQQGDAEMVEACLQHGVDVDALYDGETALHAAVWSGGPDVVRVLLKHGADHTIRNAVGNTAAEMLERKASELKPKKRGAYVALLDEIRAMPAKGKGDR